MKIYLIKKQANLAVSSDLRGFHFYGADICLIASILGYNAYVIDFHLYHESTGNMDKEFIR
jgi:NaMN:DMB phosphoribosyltransferase